MKPIDFFKKMFAGRTKGEVSLCSYANNRNEADIYPPREMVIDITHKNAAVQLQAFMGKSDVKGRATYFAVNVMRRLKRGKEEVEQINSLHLDLDFKDIIESREAVIEIMKGLGCNPSVSVFSGHGMHCYWMIEPALGIEHQEIVERLLVRLAEALAADKKTAEIARVLRVPGSHNSKDEGEWIEVEIAKGDLLTSWRTYSIAKLDKWISGLDVLLHLKEKPKPVEVLSGPLNVYQEWRRETRQSAGGGFDAESLLADMVMYTGDGIDETYTRVVGGMVNDGASLSEVLAVLLRPTKQVYLRDHKNGVFRNSPWNEKLAIKEITKKYKRFIRIDQKKEGAASVAGAADEAKEVAAPDVERATSKAPLEKLNGTKLNGTKLNGNKHHVFDEDPPDERPIKVDPFNPFEDVLAPDLPRGALPQIIEDVAFDESRRLGTDPGILAMSMLTMCATIIPYQLRLKVKRAVTDNWMQSTCFWTSIVGPPSSKKSPAMRKATEVVREIDDELKTQYNKLITEYKQMSKEERAEIDEPIKERIRISDISPEETSTLLAQNPRGLAMVTDELITFFGGLDRYGNKGGGAGRSARGMYLAAFDGRAETVDRVGRHTPVGKSASLCVLGSIQPDVVSSLVNEGSKNDGLVQRFFFIYAKKAGKGLDCDVDHPIEEYDQLIMNLYKNMPIRDGTFKFSDKAMEYKDACFEWINMQQEFAETNNPELSSHLGKWENLFVRLCLCFHVIDNWRDVHPRPVALETVQRVNRLMRDYLIPHAEAFYAALGSDEEINQLRRACKLILIRGPSHPTITVRELQLALGRRRGITAQDMEKVGSKLVTLDWLTRTTGKNNRSDSVQWRINPQVFIAMARYIPIFKAEHAAEQAKMKADFAARREENKAAGDRLTARFRDL